VKGIIMPKHDKYEVTEYNYSWGTIVTLYKNGRRVMYVDVYNDGDYCVYDQV
jgi:hypothetical protein